MTNYPMPANRSLIRSIVVLLLLTPLYSQAYDRDSTGLKGHSEIMICDGMVTVDQAAAIGEGGPYISLKAMPYKISGAAFITYRYFISDWVSFGITAGLDNQKGDLSFGDPHSFGASKLGWAGTYQRHIYTVAAEVLFIYGMQGKGFVYGYAGSGYTGGNIDYSLNAEGEIFFKPDNKPYRRNISHYNAQITPLGIKSGGRFSAFFELGFGYKGLVSTGCSLRLGSSPAINNKNSQG